MCVLCASVYVGVSSLMSIKLEAFILNSQSGKLEFGWLCVHVYMCIMFICLFGINNLDN